MRLLAIALLVAFAAPPASAADKDEDKAKEAALAFLKAVKSKDIDAVMKTVDVPFLTAVEGKPKVFEKIEDLKTDLKAKLEMIKDADKVPNEIGEVLDIAAIRKKIEGKKDEEIVKMVEKVLGEKGYAITLGKERGAVVFVRIKGDKAIVVGLPR